jgi:hypothetical protein
MMVVVCAPIGLAKALLIISNSSIVLHLDIAIEEVILLVILKRR